MSSVKAPHPGSQALLSKFSSDAERTAYFKDLAKRSHERRITLSSEEAQTLGAAYQLLGSIYAKAQAKAAQSPDESD
jgi:hypothetical protein